MLEAAAPGKKVLVGTARESTQGTIDFTNAPSGPRHRRRPRPAAVLFQVEDDPRSPQGRTTSLWPTPAAIPFSSTTCPRTPASRLEPRLVIDLAAHPNIIGLKESVGKPLLPGRGRPRSPRQLPLFPRLGACRLSRAGRWGPAGPSWPWPTRRRRCSAEIYRLFKAGKKDEARGAPARSRPSQQAARGGQRDRRAQVRPGPARLLRRPDASASSSGRRKGPLGDRRPAQEEWGSRSSVILWSNSSQGGEVCRSEAPVGKGDRREAESSERSSRVAAERLGAANLGSILRASKISRRNPPPCISGGFLASACS